jgi:hypothetical protein
VSEGLIADRHLAHKSSPPAFLFSTFYSWLPHWNVAASYDPESRITYAYIQQIDTGPSNMDYFIRYLKAAENAVLHPLLLPILISDLRTSSVMLPVKELGVGLTEIESKLTGSGLTTMRVMNPLDLDLPSISADLLTCSAKANDRARNVEFFLTVLERIGKALDTFTFNASKQGVLHTAMLRQHVEYLVISNQSMILRLKHMQTVTQTSLSGVRPYLAQSSRPLPQTQNKIYHRSTTTPPNATTGSISPSLKTPNSSPTPASATAPP